MKTSCITHPGGDPLLVVHAWQMRACDDEPCAAMLLSLFEFYHNLKCAQQKQAKKLNDVAEAHGDMGQQYTGLLQWHSEEELQKHLLGIYGIKSIRNALQLLVNKGYISIHANPNPRYHFDRTRYILFYPEPVQDFIEQYQHQAFLPDASGKNASPSGKNASPSGKNAGPITVFSSETSSMNEDPLPPGELGEEPCAAGDGESTNSTPAPSFPAPGSRAEGTNPRALGTDLRSQGRAPRQEEVQQAAAAQHADSDAIAACMYCDATGKLDLRDGERVVLARCSHDRTRIQQGLATTGYTWPHTPPGAEAAGRGGEEHAQGTNNALDGLPYAPGAPDARGLAAGPDHPGGPGPERTDPPAPGEGPDNHGDCRHGRDLSPVCLQVGRAVSGAGPAGLARPATPRPLAQTPAPCRDTGATGARGGGVAITPGAPGSRPGAGTDHGPAP